VANDDRPASPEDPLEATGIGRSIELRPGGHLGGSDPLEPPVDADFPGFRRLTFFSVLGGLCPLLPSTAGEAPAFEAVCTRMVTELGGSRGLALAPEEVRTLAACPVAEAAASGASGPAGALLQSLQHFLRRPFPGLTVRSGVRRSVLRSIQTFGRGYLLLHAAGLEMADLHPPDRTEADVQKVRAAIEATLRAADERPLEKAIAPAYRRSSAVLLRAADLLAGFLRRPVGGSRLEGPEGPEGIAAGSGALAAEGKILGPLVDQIATALWNDREGLAGLARSFETHLARERGLSV
jgi:hypothetical protein